MVHMFTLMKGRVGGHLYIYRQKYIAGMWGPYGEMQPFLILGKDSSVTDAPVKINFTIQ